MTIEIFDALYEFDDLTRFELIDWRATSPFQGRRFVTWREDQPISIGVSVQDDGKTVKVFIMDREENKQS